MMGERCVYIITDRKVIKNTKKKNDVGRRGKGEGGEVIDRGLGCGTLSDSVREKSILLLSRFYQRFAPIGRPRGSNRDAFPRR